MTMGKSTPFNKQLFYSPIMKLLDDMFVELFRTSNNG